MSWKKINTMNYAEDVRFLAKKEIAQNNDSKYWKQSLVCKIAYYGNYTMKIAWKIFNILLVEKLERLMDIVTDIKEYNVLESETIKILQKYNTHA